MKGTISRQERENIELVKEFILAEAKRVRAIRRQSHMVSQDTYMVILDFDLTLGEQESFPLLELAQVHLSVVVSHDPRQVKTSYSLKQQGHVSGQAFWILQNRILALRDLACRWGHAARTLKLPRTATEYNRGYYTRHGNLLHVSF